MVLAAPVSSTSTARFSVHRSVERDHAIDGTEGHAKDAVLLGTARAYLRRREASEEVG